MQLRLHHPKNSCWRGEFQDICQNAHASLTLWTLHIIILYKLISIYSIHYNVWGWGGSTMVILYLQVSEVLSSVVHATSDDWTKITPHLCITDLLQPVLLHTVLHIRMKTIPIWRKTAVHCKDYMQIVIPIIVFYMYPLSCFMRSPGCARAGNDLL